MTTFVVFSLPRSRSAWLSTVLCSSGNLVGHDIGIDCKTPEEFIEQLKIRGGTCETGAAFAWKTIKREIPDVKFAVVFRNPEEVNDSLEQFGLTGYEDELERRFEDLRTISELPGVFSCSFEDLKDSQVVSELHRYCTGTEPALPWIEKLQETNIQVNMRDRITKLVQNADSIAALKKQIADRNTGLRIAVEPWSVDLWSDIEQYANAHFEEVDGGIEPGRLFKIDHNLMSNLQQSGSLQFLVARKDGEFVGYLSWNISFDVESEGLLVAHQGAWYVRPGNSRTAVELFEKSIEVLKQCGVKCIFPHHRTQGRGANIGKFFKRHGATLIQHTYSLWIGD